ncbi:MAG: glutamine-hydrolyzing GMP synthase [Sandaracinaceae bacterium]
MARSYVLILDFGSQYTQLIARRIREQHVYCEIQPCTLPIEKIRELAPQAIVLSGGPASVYEEGAPDVDPAIFDLGLPILGICYGMQLFCRALGGTVEPASEREYGAARIQVVGAEGILESFEADALVDVWMSHGDRVAALPEGFVALGRTDSAPFAAVGNAERKIYGLQFHPEVAHTPRGPEILEAFLFSIAGLEADWTPGSFIEETIEKVRAQVGDGHAICGLSGGVDSSVAAMLVHRAIGDRLTCIFVDNGLLRLGEAHDVVKMFRDHFHLRLVHVDASKQFLEALAGVSDPEEKRKIIGRVFIEVFDAEAKKIEGAGHLVQGTLYPDVIESVSFKGPARAHRTPQRRRPARADGPLSLIRPLRSAASSRTRSARSAPPSGCASACSQRRRSPAPASPSAASAPSPRTAPDPPRGRTTSGSTRSAAPRPHDMIWQAFARCSRSRPSA